MATTLEREATFPKTAISSRREANFENRFRECAPNSTLHKESDKEQARHTEQARWRTFFYCALQYALKACFQTVEYMRPATFVFELGELPAQAAREEIQQKIAELLNKAGSPMYVMQTVSGLNPGFSGYPIHRPRLFVLGWRMDNGTPDTMTAPLQCLLAKPMEI